MAAPPRQLGAPAICGGERDRLCLGAREDASRATTMLQRDSRAAAPMTAVDLDAAMADRRGARERRTR
jgi:hypothetical protein